MTFEEIGHQLHAKYSRGEALTEEEQLQLNKWYASQDEKEFAALGINQEIDQETQLRQQIENALAQLVWLSEKIQKIASENESLKNENSILKQQLSSILGQQSA